FDGAPESNFPDGSNYKGIKIFYADRNSDADTRIKRIVESHKNSKSLTVVTSDNRLIGYVRSCSAAVVRSGEFRKDMEAALAAAPVEEGPSEPDAGDIK